MNINSYIDLYQVLEDNPTTIEDNRAFGLKHKSLRGKPQKQLLAWADKYKSKLQKPLISLSFSSYLYGITITLVILAFIFGLFSGMGLLSYDGKEPVNIIYFIAMVVFLPIFTMTLTALSMFRINQTKSILMHISPAFWMEKILGWLPSSIKDDIKEFKINPLLTNWIIIKRSQLVALSFSFGLFVALLGVVVTQDIAFAWSTTIDITPETFHQFLYFISAPWRYLFPSFVPSIELIEHSQYFRLGDRLSPNIISHASSLGEWWRFLAFATLFYAIVLRLLVLVVSHLGLRYAVSTSILKLIGTNRLLREINQPIINTNSTQQEALFVPTHDGYEQTIEKFKEYDYDMIQGLGMRYDELLVISDSIGLSSPKHAIVGGSNSLDEDDKVIDDSSGDILLFVKAWEPPMMDFVDYLADLSINDNVKKVIIMPIGTLEDDYKTTDTYIDIWANKLSLSEDGKVWLKR